MHKSPNPVQSSIELTILRSFENQNTDAKTNNGNLIQITLSMKANIGKGLNALEINKVIQNASIVLTQNCLSQDQF